MNWCVNLCTVMNMTTGSLPMILDHLLDVFRGASLYQKELCIVISHVLLGAGGRGCVEEMGEVGCSPELFVILCISL